jgi:predicted DNA-binding transcriptional regulator AlpA
MQSKNGESGDTLREIAHSLGCLVPSEIQALTGWSESTLEAYRKRGKGPSFIKTGKHYLYPRSGVVQFMADNTRSRQNIGRDLL